METVGEGPCREPSTACLWPWHRGLPLPGPFLGVLCPNWWVSTLTAHLAHAAFGKQGSGYWYFSEASQVTPNPVGGRQCQPELSHCRDRACMHSEATTHPRPRPSGLSEGLPSPHLLVGPPWAIDEVRSGGNGGETDPCICITEGCHVFY